MEHQNDSAAKDLVFHFFSWSSGKTLTMSSEAECIKAMLFPKAVSKTAVFHDSHALGEATLLDHHLIQWEHLLYNSLL